MAETPANRLHQARVSSWVVAPMLIVTTMRPFQWIKNMVIGFPLLFTVGETWGIEEEPLDFSLAWKTLAAIGLFCALSGAVYLLNDVLDRKNDALHPRKRYRPVASGRLSTKLAVATAVTLALVSVGGGFVISMGFASICLAYLAINLGYSLGLKHLVLLEVMLLASGYVLRLAAGSLMIDVETSPWLYVTIGLGALFMALGKRYSELVAVGGDDQSTRQVLGLYTLPLLDQLTTIAATAALVAYAIYTFTSPTLPDNHIMMLTIPFVLFGLFRYLYLVHMNQRDESPEIILLKDVPLLVTVTLWALTSVLILLVQR